MRVTCDDPRIKRVVEIIAGMLDDRFFITDRCPAIDKLEIRVIINRDVVTISRFARDAGPATARALMNDDVDYKVDGNIAHVFLKKNEDVGGDWINFNRWTGIMLVVPGAFVARSEGTPVQGENDPPFTLETREKNGRFHRRAGIPGRCRKNIQQLGTAVTRFITNIMCRDIDSDVTGIDKLVAETNALIYK